MYFNLIYSLFNGSLFASNCKRTILNMHKLSFPRLSLLICRKKSEAHRHENMVDSLHGNREHSTVVDYKGKSRFLTSARAFLIVVPNAFFSVLDDIDVANRTA